MPLAAILYLIAAVLGGVAFFAPGWRYNLVGAAVGCIGLGLFVQAIGA